MSVLIVDDSETLRKRLKEALSLIRTDLEFYEASSGEEALSVYSPKMHDIVILDISLPDMSGIEILKQIKNFRSRHKGNYFYKLSFRRIQGTMHCNRG